MDNLTICDRCGSDACYVQEVNHEIKNHMCYGCGFITNSLMKDGEQFWEEQFALLPNLYKELCGEDEKTGLIWMPNTINLPNKGMVFAEGTSKDSWKWAAVKSSELSEEDQVKYKAKTKPDMTTITRFKERDYMDALSYIGVLPG